MGRPAYTFQEHVNSFWKRVQIKGANECWPYGTTVYTKRGYPMGRYALHAHRFSYLLHKGAIPEGLQVLHECDNRNCVNPAHLTVGTQSKNLTDCAMRRRLPRARFSFEDIRKMRSLYIGGVKQTVIAKQFNTVSGVVSNIVNGKRWTQVK